MTASPDTPAPCRPMRKDAARNRELLIDAAREVFAQRGLEASLDDVAHRAGLGVGTAYRHFANKYELAGAILEHAVDEIVAHAEHALTVEDPWQALVGFLEASLEAQTVDRGLREVLLGVHDPERMQQVHDRLVGPISELIRRTQRSGAMRAEIESTDLGIVIMMLCTVSDIAGDDAPQLWRRYLPLLLAGLQADEPALPVPALSETRFRELTADHKRRMVRASAAAPARVRPR